MDETLYQKTPNRLGPKFQIELLWWRLTSLWKHRDSMNHMNLQSFANRENPTLSSLPICLESYSSSVFENSTYYLHHSAAGISSLHPPLIALPGADNARRGGDIELPRTDTHQAYENTLPEVA
jgi:hypothetical protein